MGLRDQGVSKAKNVVHEKFRVVTEELAKIRKNMEELEVQDPMRNQTEQVVLI
jgi:hypothetical protein